MNFRWNLWNLEHTGLHGVSPREAERVAENGKALYRGDGKYLVYGRGNGGRWLQVIYVLDEDGSLYIIHARPLNEREKRRLRRRKK